MKKKILVASLGLSLLFSLVAGSLLVNSATANPYTPLHLPKITINSDGTITPQTSYINRVDNTYTLTADINQQYSIEILCSNIVFDGAGHIINVTIDGIFSDNGYPAAYVDVGINLVNVHNVILKNVKAFANNINTINLQFSSNCKIVGVTTGKNVRILGDSNVVTESNTGISVSEGNNNLITRNNITYVFVGNYCFENKFYQNNFYLTENPEFFSKSLWDNGSIGNYWANYTIKYPDALEIGNSGICNTPYTIMRGSYTTKEYPDIVSIDNFPLMYPWGAPEIIVPNLENATYSGNVPLNFSVNKPSLWLGYTLDGGNNVTVTGNSTLEGLATGYHNLTIYAKDTFGDIGASETITFTVETPFPFVSVIVVFVVTVGLVIACLLGYHKKHKNQQP